MIKDYLLKLHFVEHGEFDGFESPFGKDFPDSRALIKMIERWHEEYPDHKHFEFDLMTHTHSFGMVTYQWWLVGVK